MRRVVLSVSNTKDRNREQISILNGLEWELH